MYMGQHARNLFSVLLCKLKQSRYFQTTGGILTVQILKIEPKHTGVSIEAHASGGQGFSKWGWQSLYACQIEGPSGMPGV